MNHRLAYVSKTKVNTKNWVNYSNSSVVYICVIYRGSNSVPSLPINYSTNMYLSIFNHSKHYGFMVGIPMASCCYFNIKERRILSIFEDHNRLEIYY